MHPDKTKNDAFYKKMIFLPRAISWYGAYYFEAYPLDMSQYGRLFQSTRYKRSTLAPFQFDQFISIPKKGKDELLSSPNSRHVVVQVKNHQCRHSYSYCTEKL